MNLDARFKEWTYGDFVLYTRAPSLDRRIVFKEEEINRVIKHLLLRNINIKSVGLYCIDENLRMQEIGTNLLLTL
jgi:hypothetical protein